MKTTILPMLLAAGAAGFGQAQAQMPGDGFGDNYSGDKANAVKAGVAYFSFNDESGDLAGPNTPPGVQVAVEDTTVTAVQYSRLIGNRFGIEAQAGIPYEVDVNAAGTLAGAGQVVSTTVASVTLLGTYYFTDRGATWRPFVSAGYNYSTFYDTEATPTLAGALSGETAVDLDDTTGPGIYAGLNYDLTDNLFLTGMVAYQRADTEATLTTDTVVEMDGAMVPVGEATRTIDVDFNPVIAFATVGFRF